MRQTHREGEGERERDRDRGRDRQTDRERGGREGGRDRDRQTDRQTVSQTDRHTETETDTDTETQRQRQRDRDRRQRQRELFHRGLNSGSLAWESAVLTIRPRSCLMQLSLYHPRFVDGTTRWRLEETRRKNGSRSVYIIYGSALSSTLCGGCLFCAVRG